MRLHDFLEYRKFRRQAKTQHGVHSPFVFEFTRKVLLSDLVISNFAVDRILPLNQIVLPEYEKQLFYRILKYYKCDKVLSFIENADHKVEKFIGTQTAGTELQPLDYQADCIFIFVRNPHAWNSLFQMYRNTLNPNSVVVIMHNHKGELHNEEWETLTARQDVPLSIDVFNMGLLFFKTEFKEKQHFLLKERLKKKR